MELPWGTSGAITSILTGQGVDIEAYATDVFGEMATDYLLKNFGGAMADKAKTVLSLYQADYKAACEGFALATKVADATDTYYEAMAQAAKAQKDFGYAYQLMAEQNARELATYRAAQEFITGLAGIDPKSTWDNAGEYSKTYFNTMIMDEVASSSIADKATIFYGRYGYQMNPYTAPSMYHPEGLGLMLFMTADENIEDFFPSTANYESQGYLSSTSRFDTWNWPVYSQMLISTDWKKYIAQYETARRGKGYTRIW